MPSHKQTATAGTDGTVNAGLNEYIGNYSYAEKQSQYDTRKGGGPSQVLDHCRADGDALDQVMAECRVLRAVEGGLKVSLYLRKGCRGGEFSFPATRCRPPLRRLQVG